MLVMYVPARHRFGLLGSWRVTATGIWKDNGGGMCAQAWFESFAVHPLELLGMSTDRVLPTIRVPVPSALQPSSDWCTTYLDPDTRIARGAGGMVFLFKRQPRLRNF